MPVFQTVRSVRAASAIGAGLLVVAVGGFLALSSTAGSSAARLLPQLKEAIVADETSSSLPPGFAVGHASGAAQAALRASLVDRFERYTAGSQLTRDLNASLAWASRMATQDGGGGFLKAFQLESFSTDAPLIIGSAATVSGSYTIMETIVDSLADGSSQDRRGRWSFDFVAQLQDIDGRWKIADISHQQTDFEFLGQPSGGPIGSPVAGPPKPSQESQGQPILPQHQPTQP